MCWTILIGFDSHSHHQSICLNPFFQNLLLKTMSTWFLAIETAMLQIHLNFLSIRTGKKVLLHIQCKIHPNLDKPLPLISFVLQQYIKTFRFQTNWNHFVLDLSKIFRSSRKSPMSFWHKTEKHFLKIDTIWFRFIPRNLCSYHTFNKTMNKLLK